MIYLIDSTCISPQNTFGVNPFEGGVVTYNSDRYYAIEPDYRGIIPPRQIRRMGKFSRLGIGAGGALIKKHPEIDGILIGTANGGLENSVRFLDQIMQYDEGTLTPTHFVQSTANSVSGTLALINQNNGYNTTYVSVGLAFETALLDALLSAREGLLNKMLVGGVEEISDYNCTIDFHRGLFKSPPVPSTELIGSGTPGTAAGEGAAMFVFDSQHRDDTLATVLDVALFQTDHEETILNKAVKLLATNGIDHSDVGCVITGMNGDAEGDAIYRNFAYTINPDAPVVTFKNLTGEFPTASSFALWMAGLQHPLPAESILKRGNSEGKHILIYNHYRGQQHGMILLHNENLQLSL